jgi:hypothetical protein
LCTAADLRQQPGNVFDIGVFEVKGDPLPAVFLKIQQVKSAARGFRNFDNFRIAILFFCGTLDMYPQKS